KQHDNGWIIDLVHQSLAGDALRWHAMLPKEVQSDWYSLQQALLTQFPFVFRGIDGVECNSFVRYVRRKAVKEGKLKDPVWMADYAAGAFSDDALRWYDTLDEETRGNWNLLQTALFQKYAASGVRGSLSDYTENQFAGLVAVTDPDNFWLVGSSETLLKSGLIGCLLWEIAPEGLLAPVWEDKFVFRGTDTNDSECEEFIEAVRRFAFDQGKQHDNQWIVDLVHKSLAGDALRWHAMLPQEIQNDWYRLQQALLTQFPVVFRGIDGVECDSFVRHVRRKAVNEGKLQDSAWMANYAAGAFAGDALRWYDTLDEETKGSWNLLQTALFLKYPASNTEGSLSHLTGKRASTTMTSLAPTPAAASVPAVQGSFPPGATAFVKVTTDYAPELSGHISRFLQHRGRHISTRLRGDRLLVLPVTSGNYYHLKLVGDPVCFEDFLTQWWCHELYMAVYDMSYVVENTIGPVKRRAQPVEWLAWTYVAWRFRSVIIQHVAVKVQSDLAFVGNSWLAQVRLFPNEKISSVLLLIILSTDKLVFRGTDTNDSECEDFVEAVRRFAFDQGKQHDNQWIVDLVHKSLVGDALRWHVTLPQEVQNDWYLLQQALMAQFPVVFRGIGGVECDSFVRHVRRKAVNEGKLQDPAWMANYAAGAFAGDALRWYDTLDKETKGNWDLLQTALFLKYPASDVQSPLSHFSRQGASTTITSPAPIPAAAPVPLGQGRFAPGVTAFIEVTADGGPELSGHVSRFLQTDGRHVVTKLKSERLCVLAVASEKQYRLKLVNPAVPFEYLGLKWNVNKPDLVSQDRAKN
ncbi:hypothetical protein FRB99_000952, partial [Tulasnella sp. 403]